MAFLSKQTLDIVDSVLELPPEQRASYLDRICDEPSVRQYVEGLLLAYEGAGGCLDQPAFVVHSHLLDALVLEPWLGRQIGPYELVEEIGEGGMGTVYRAVRIDDEYHQHVAIKIVGGIFASRHLLDRFRVERQILANLNHPNIARLLDGGTTPEGVPFLVMELIVGTPITAYCDKRRLPLRKRVELLLQVCGAVQYAHQNLVVHRDLKPSNILVTEDGQVHLLDFGIAKILTEGVATETPLTQLGGRALTPDYAAPEQIAGAPITTATDVYALGVMLYELLTGERPYKLKRDSRGALEEAILHADPVAPSRATLTEAAAPTRATTARKLLKAVKGDLDTIVIKALQKAPTERYATTIEFAEDIARYLRGDVVLAQRDRVGYRALKFARRHGVAMAAASVLILTLAGGLAATTYEARLASAQRDVALQAQLRALTQTAAVRLKDGDFPGALSIILGVLPRGSGQSYTPEALSVFQEARAADAQVLAITGHTDRVRFVGFSPDGRRIVTASFDRTARIWDAATGRELVLLSGHTDELSGAAFSPDGKRVVTASHDKTARVWDAATGRELILLSGHGDQVRSAAYSPDGQRIVTASHDGTARIWEAASGREIVMLRGHTGRVERAAFSSDGGRVVTASDDKTARIWDAATGREIISLSGHLGQVWSAAFSSDGTRVVTASDDRTARIWDAATGRELILLRGHTALVASAAFSPDGRRIVTASYDKSARIWDAATGREITLLGGHSDYVENAAFSPDGRRVVTGSNDRTARVWDAGNGREIMLLSGHTDALGTASFSPDGRRFVTASYDRTARVWDAAGREIMQLSGHTDRLSSAAYSPDGRHIVTAWYDKTAGIWDAATGRELLQLRGHTDLVFSAAFSPDSRRVVTASLDRTARIWDAATGREIGLLRGHADGVHSAAFSPDGRHIVTASSDQTARIWDAATGREVVLLRGHADRVWSAAFSPDGRRVVTASIDKTARLWDTATGRELMLLRGHSNAVGSAAFSPDGGRVVTTSDDMTARIWDAFTGQQTMLLSGHTDGVEGAAFSPDGRRVITASDDMTARIWDVRAPALDIQIEWAEAAQFDSLPSLERFQLGLPAPTDVRQWPADGSTCDQSAAAPYDPDRRAPGVLLDRIATDTAIAACAGRPDSSRDQARSVYQHGRALMANRNFSGARRDFEKAIARGYRAARVDLARLLSQPSTGMLDVPQAIALYERAKGDGITIAAFELGKLYEYGVREDGREYALAPDRSRAWVLYREGADISEPNALARFAQQEDAAAFSVEGPTRRNAQLLESFKHFAAAAERARREDWPDDAWKNWRYRRASLARLLAREGMMQEVAKEYEGVRGPHAGPQPMWRSLISLARKD